MRPASPWSAIRRSLELVLLAGIGVLLCHVSFRPARSLEEFFRDDGEFIRGDANDDTEIDISDPLRILGFLFIGLDSPPCLTAADADDDGALQINDAVILLGFLFQGGPAPAAPFPEAGLDPTPDLGCREPPLPPLPAPGSLGGPDRELTAEEGASWLRGRRIFDRRATVAGGLGPFFNGDSCRGCHLDPVIGGSGGLDVNVVRFAYRDENGLVSQLPGGPATSRLALHGLARDEVADEANIVETRQTPSLLGLGLVDRLPESALLENADPGDDDGDGISGRARMVGDRVGRFGHKSGVPSLRDFAADALFNEIGLTVDIALSGFAVPHDTDGATDPEFDERDFADLVFFTTHIAPPSRTLPDDPARVQSIEEGEAIFGTLGCGSCHVPELVGPDGPVSAYSDFLLHDVGNPDRFHVDEPGVEPGEFRTAPLWGLRDTGPYLHDGSAATVRDAIVEGHFGEATDARERYNALPFVDKLLLEDFLLSL